MNQPVDVDYDKLAAAVAKYMRSAVPLSAELWDLEMIGLYLRRSSSVVRERFACLPDFPKPIRLPSDQGNRAHPLWKAVEVIAWTEAHRDDKPGRPRKN
jgi:hypothetical protein